jgi:transcription elongation factor Elf1
MAILEVAVAPKAVECLGGVIEETHCFACPECNTEVVINPADVDAGLAQGTCPECRTSNIVRIP